MFSNLTQKIKSLETVRFQSFLTGADVHNTSSSPAIHILSFVL